MSDSNSVFKSVLIEPYWNVKSQGQCRKESGRYVLIEPYWNVKWVEKESLRSVLMY